MKKFEEEVKRPTTTSLRPLTYRDNILKELSNIVKANYTKNAQILREHKEYINFLESRLKECEDLRIEANNKAAMEYSRKCEVVEDRAELKRENQRLRAENIAVKTLVEDAKKQQPELPQFVAEYARDCERELSDVLDEIYMETDYLEDHSTRIEREGLIARYWLYNRTVAKEKRFYLKNKLTGLYLAIDSSTYIEIEEKWLDAKRITSYKPFFTQSQIDGMETGSYEQIEVEE